MHYGFAPGRTAQDRRVRSFFQRREQTQLVHRGGLSTVRSFVQHLATASSGITRPIDDALIGAHANSEGQVFVPMFRGQQGPTVYETLEETLATASNSIEIADATIGHTAGDPITHHLHFKGCNIGKARPFLEKLKEAAGGNVHVTAPMHFHGLTPEPRYGMFEYLCYEFTVRSPTRFANRAALVTAFQGAGFTFVDGTTAVPAATWNTKHARWQQKWIPNNIRRTAKYQVRAPLATAVGTRGTIRVPQQFRVERWPFTWRIRYPNAASVPSGNAARRTALEDSLREDNGRPNPAGPSRFSAAHDYPYYERLGYDSFDDFMDGYTWSLTKKGSTLVCRGTRTEYTIVIPITDAADNLLINFHPNASSTHARQTAFTESDAKLFETV